MEYSIINALRAATQDDRRVLVDAYVTLRDTIITHNLLQDQNRQSEGWRRPFLFITKEKELHEGDGTFTGRSPFQGGFSGSDIDSLLESFSSHQVALPPMGWLSQAFSLVHFRLLNEFLIDLGSTRLPLLVTSTKRQLSRSEYINSKVRRSAHAYGWALDVHFLNPIRSLSRLYSDSALLTPFTILTQENVARYSLVKSTTLNSMVYALAVAIVNSFPSTLVDNQVVAEAFIDKAWDEPSKASLRRHISSLLSSPRGTSVSWMFGQLESSPRTTWLHTEALIPWSRGISKHFSSLTKASSDLVIDTMSCNTAWMQTVGKNGIKGTKEIRWDHRPVNSVINNMINQV